MKYLRRPSPALIAHLGQLLDEALNETFPASDPVAITIEFASAEAALTAPFTRAPASGAIRQTVRRANGDPMQMRSRTLSIALDRSVTACVIEP